MSRIVKFQSLISLIIWAVLGLSFFSEEPLGLVAAALYLMLLEVLVIAEMDAERTRLRSALNEIRVLLPELEGKPGNKALKHRFAEQCRKFENSHHKLFGQQEVNANDS
ncbi:hypothetical protein VIBNIFTn2_120013 [Vibrio nigripulchritudo FTn2]|uniref:hypothetical protein n=1 Tax=Vibrio nigripulchritudo TaxID=28173 RepID=UPI0003B23E18|nr:hypothetical protein [Vibrio nigripulchritudo]CCN40031.1 hypothetical protein VIBNIFTn2_120013 [Vibrio nigripulchritudo FTn2]